MPLCARCLSMISGVFIALILDIQIGYMSFVLLAPVIIDGGLHYSGIKPSSNPRRLVSGILGGIGLWSVTMGIEEIVGGIK